MAESSDMPTEKSRSSSHSPRTVEGLDMTEVDDGMIIYDERSDRVHYLNSTAAVVLQLCDGQRTLPDIAAICAQLFELEVQPLDEIQDCLLHLEREGLVI